MKDWILSRGAGLVLPVVLGPTRNSPQRRSCVILPSPHALLNSG